MKKVDSVFDESVILDDSTQEICNEHNVTEINYQKGRRMVLVNITNTTSTKSAFGDHIKSAVGGFLLGSKVAIVKILSKIHFSVSTIWPPLHTLHIENSTNMA